MKRFTSGSLAVLALTLAACSTGDSPIAPDSNAALSRGGGPNPSVGNGAVVIVTHDSDGGRGSLREAITLANANPAIRRIEIKPANRTITIGSALEFTGTQPLTIEGKNTTIDASSVSGSALIANGGADLTVESLTIRDAGGEGLDVQVPTDASGTIRVVLRNFTALRNGGHGVLIDDQEFSPTTDGVQPNGNGSDASVNVTVINSRFIGNGYTVSDRDGLRVDEGGLGDLTFVAVGVRAEDNAADGIELDERGEGDVRLDVSHTDILRNGKFDNADLDDGFDIDEYDAGSIVGKVVATRANDNYEEGLDFNENNAGDLRVDLADVEANNNREEGIDYEEDDDFAGGGDLVTTMVDITTNGNGADGGDAGLKIREKGDGNLTATVTRVDASSNVIGGISVREDAAGQPLSSIVYATANSNTGIGIDFDENADGDLTAAVSNASSNANGGAGVRGDEGGAGTGSLTLTNVTTAGNTGGATTGNVVPVIIP